MFDGKNCKPYVESDIVNPENIYGLTKLKGEQAIRKIDPKGIIIRTSSVYSEFGSNFIKTIFRVGKERTQLDVISDQVGTPTFAGDLAKSIVEIIGLPNFDKFNKSNKIFHYSNEGVCSWFDLAKAVIELSSLDCKVMPIESKDYPTPANRPQNSVLNKSKIENEFGILIPHWMESLKKLFSSGCL